MLKREYERRGPNVIGYLASPVFCIPVHNILGYYVRPLTGERFPLRSTNTEEGARLDIKAQKFWDKSKKSTFFDVRIFNSHAPANCTSSTDACYRRHEREKRRAYEQRVLEVEHGTFTPLVLSTSGGWGPSATVAFKRLAGLISEKHDQPYSSTLSFIRLRSLSA